MFLKASGFSIPTQMHDYPEWHLGRENYALWYVEIHHPQLTEYLYALREEFSEFLFSPNTRQFHITLFICGFLTETEKQHNDDFSMQQYAQQVQQLVQENLTEFSLSTGKINSFDSALFVEIVDTHNALKKIRQVFAQSFSEIAALDYCPHITLGLYTEAFKAEDIYLKVRHIKQQPFEFSVSHLTFGFYRAKVLQGELYSYAQIPLSCVPGSDHPIHTGN